MEVFSQNSQLPCSVIQKPLTLPLRLMVKLSEENSLLPPVSKRRQLQREEIKYD